ncbi:hydroxyacid dehydrogenase [Ramlibacter sp. AW1]|uniref:Hydroxyacid dehydrogenase n=1 Tax=Ramlibacter aurantiacus TaxID=2801330 RepID=A0A937D3Q6_9BURK|nr:NAD(P)-dependent oxidoreductase [Ramlibacter aurantiacus]MBL0420965.1 hydroxyacid dehydrogenase [Ramlibacter aurantiacus]
MDILLIERLVPECVAWLEARHTVEHRPDVAYEPGALRAAVGSARAVVLPRKAVVTREFLAAAPMLRIVGRMHADTDNTDLEACRERRVEVVQARSAHVRSNAEFLLASLLMLYRRGIGLPLAGQRHADFRVGRELGGSTVGLLGIAPAAHTLALLLRGLGARLIGYDPAVHRSSPLWSRLNVEPVGLYELVSFADAISVQIIYGSRYQHLVNDRLLAYCKPGQYWVSISRSAVFEPHALARALADGRIDSCVVDGAEAGFASRGSPLHESNNLYLTPRLGSHTREARVRASWFLAGRLHDCLTRADPVPDTAPHDPATAPIV